MRRGAGSGVRKGEPQFDTAVPVWHALLGVGRDAFMEIEAGVAYGSFHSLQQR